MRNTILILTLLFIGSSVAAQWRPQPYSMRYQGVKSDSLLVPPKILTNPSLLESGAIRYNTSGYWQGYIAEWVRLISSADTAVMLAPYAKKTYVDSSIKDSFSVKIAGSQYAVSIFSASDRLAAQDVYYTPSSRSDLGNVKEFIIGRRPFTTRSAKITVSDTIIADAGYHGIGEYNYVQQSGNNNSGYASIDINTNLSGLYDWSHYYAIQQRSTLTGTTGISGEYVGIWSINQPLGTGLVDTSINIKVLDPSGSSPINTNMGLYLGPMTRGTTNWSIYSAGGPSFFSGPIHYANSGTGAPTFTTRSAGSKLLFWPSLSGSQVDYGMGMLSNGIWLSLPSASTGNVFAIYGGTTRSASIDGTGQAVFGASVNPTSTLQSGGSFAVGIANVTSNTTLTVAHGTILVNNSNMVTITLPAAGTCTGRIYVIKKISNNAFTVSIDPNGSELIDGTSTPKDLTAYLQKVSIQSDGTSWWIIGD